MYKIRKNGFTLIEVLISVFVLALGVIGAAGMQLNAMRTGQQSGFQTIAVQLATEMADNMRANANQLNQDDSANPYLISYNSATDANPTTPGKICYGAAVTCNGAELAAFDIYEWEKRLKAALPGGRVVICRDATPWNSTDAALSWTCSYTLATTNNAPFVIEVG